jgi:hypothetical protein
MMGRTVEMNGQERVDMNKWQREDVFSIMIDKTLEQSKDGQQLEKAIGKKRMYRF